MIWLPTLVRGCRELYPFPILLSTSSDIVKVIFGHQELLELVLHGLHYEDRKELMFPPPSVITCGTKWSHQWFRWGLLCDWYFMGWARDFTNVSRCMSVCCVLTQHTNSYSQTAPWTSPGSFHCWEHLALKGGEVRNAWCRIIRTV